MSSAWSWYIVIGTLVSIFGCMWLLFANRKITGNKTTGHEWDGIEELDNPLPMWWVGMFVGSVIFALLYLVWYPGLGNYLGFGEWTSQKQLQELVDAHETRFAPLYTELASLDAVGMANDRRARQVGRRLFLNNCSICHGPNAEGTTGFPNLTDNDWIWGGDMDAITASITNGRHAVMPAWGAALGDHGVREVTQYVLKLAGQSHNARLAELGMPRFAVMCIACHGPEGKGSKVLGGPDLTNDIWLYGGDASAIAQTIRDGRNGNMPAQREILGTDKIKLLAGYVFNLSNAE